ncbi:gasdermin-C [Canis lupus dingo]|uniref:gasdermin-C n=1 Tax=Canis lupus dingo TaxID=286419 RepID=UPI0020C33795|nr:gasdermin-C [Canis lupus dingo]
MPSLFEHISKNLVRELGDKDLRPMRCLSNANQFRQLAILQKRKKRSPFWEQPDIPAEYTLMDLLEPSSSVPETAVMGPFLFSDTVVQQGQVSANVTTGLEMNVSGKATVFHGSSLQFQAVTIPPHNWKDLQKRKVQDPELLFLVKCRDRQDNLYVVTDTVELTDTTVLCDNRSVNVWGSCFLPFDTFFKGRGQGEGLKVREKTLILPQGTVMAYKRKQLVFKENGWDILISDDDKEKTFPEEKLRMQSKSLPSTINSGFIPPRGRTQEPFRQDFKQLHEEIFQEVEALDELSKDTQDAIFHNILNTLGNRKALLELMDRLDGDPFDPLDGFGGEILNETQEDTRNLWIQGRSSIIYLLEAIIVLSDTQHNLLAQSMKKRILLQQQELVRSILEPNFKYPWNIPFTLKPELLAPLQGEGLAITYGLLQECGLNIELNSPRSTWDLEVKQPLSALYATLSMLQQLAGSQRGQALPVYTGSVPELNQSQSIQIEEMVAGAVTGAMNVSIGLPVQVTGSSGVTHSSTLTVHTLRVSPHTWETGGEEFLSSFCHPQVTLNKQSRSPGQSYLGRPGPPEPWQRLSPALLFSCPTPTHPCRKLRTPKPSFLKELQHRKEKEGLYVVTEAVETTQDTMLQSLNDAKGSGQLAFLGPGHLKVGAGCAPGVPIRVCWGCGQPPKSSPSTLTPVRWLPH